MGYPQRLFYNLQSGGGSVPLLAIVRRPGIGAEINIPGAGPVNVLSGTPFGTFGLWTLINAALASDTFLTKIVGMRTAVGAAIGNVDIEFSYGAGNTPLAAIRYCQIINDPTGDDAGRYGLTLNLPNVKWPSGQQLNARVTEQAAAANWAIEVCGWSGAIPGFTAAPTSSPTGINRYYPSNVSTGLSVTGGIAPAFGNWFTVVDPAPNDMYVTHIQAGSTGAGATASNAAWQLGIGAVGSEQAVCTSFTPNDQGLAPIDPVVWVKAGERLAVRLSTIGGSVRRCVIGVVDL